MDLTPNTLDNKFSQYLDDSMVLDYNFISPSYGCQIHLILCDKNNTQQIRQIIFWQSFDKSQMTD